MQLLHHDSFTTTTTTILHQQQTNNPHSLSSSSSSSNNNHQRQQAINAMCQSATDINAWLGSGLVHLAFLTIILWSAVTADHPHVWKVGLVCSILYTVLLFGLARWLEVQHQEEYTLLSPYQQQEQQQEQGEATAAVAPTPSTTNNTNNNTESPRRIHPLFINLLYGAAVLSLGVPGAFVALRAIPCCTTEAQIRYRHGAALVLVAMPVTVVSMRLWHTQTKQYSSLIVTALIGISLGLHNICRAIDPGLDAFATGLFVTGAVLVLYLTRVKLLSSNNHDDDSVVPAEFQVLQLFGLSLAAALYFAGACGIFLTDTTTPDYPEQHSTKYWHMVQLGHIIGSILLCFVPLAILGVATDCVIMTLLGALGLFLDALQFADWFARPSHRFAVPIHAAVLALAGLAIGALGLALEQLKPEIKHWVTASVSCGANANGDGDDATEGAVVGESPETPLLLATEEQ